jgi:hypothetical protein
MVEVVDYLYKGFQFRIIEDEDGCHGYAWIHPIAKNPSFRCWGKKKVELKRKFRLYVKSLPEEIFERVVQIKPGQEIARS